MKYSGNLYPRILWGTAAVLFLGIPCGITLLRAQQDTTFSSDVNVVNIFAIVRDKQLKIVTTLAKDDFILNEDGRPQTIRYFSQESDLPLTLGLLIDTSLSQRNVLDREKDASYSFLDQILRPDKDKTFVIHFDHETELLQDLTSSHRDLQKALEAVKLPADARSKMRQPGQGGGRYPNGNGRNARQAGTTLYDAIFLAADELMKKQKGRKALILLTDGVDEGSKESLFEAIRAAQRSDTLVYSIYFTDSEGYGQQRSGISLGGMGRMGGMGRGRGGHGGGQERPDGKKILEQISRETGGGFFQVTRKDTIDDIYRKIQEEMRNQYSIGYVSDQGQTGSGFRHITLTAKKSGVIVQAPAGYYPAGQ